MLPPVIHVCIPPTKPCSQKHDTACHLPHMPGMNCTPVKCLLALVSASQKKKEKNRPSPPAYRHVYHTRQSAWHAQRTQKPGNRDTGSFSAASSQDGHVSPEHMLCIFDKGTECRDDARVPGVDGPCKHWSSCQTHPSFMSLAFVNSSSSRSEAERSSSTYVLTISFRIPLRFPVATGKKESVRATRSVHVLHQGKCMANSG